MKYSITIRMTADDEYWGLSSCEDHEEQVDLITDELNLESFGFSNPQFQITNELEPSLRGPVLELTEKIAKDLDLFNLLSKCESVNVENVTFKLKKETKEDGLPNKN